MSQIVIKYGTLSLSQQVLERQEGHAQAIATYLPANADIGDSTGLLLSVFDPLSKVAVTVGSDAAKVLGELEQAMAGAVGDTQVDVADQDGQVGDAFSKLIGRIGVRGADSNYPDLGGPTLPAAGEAPRTGTAASSRSSGRRTQATAEALTGSISDVGGLIDQVGQWGGDHQGHRADGRLVVPHLAVGAGEPGLRTCAGAPASCSAASTGWPRSSSASRSSTAASTSRWPATGRASTRPPRPGTTPATRPRPWPATTPAWWPATPQTWQGLSGNSFRAAMTTIAGATYGLSAAYTYAGGLVKTLSTVTKLACVGIGKLLQDDRRQADQDGGRGRDAGHRLGDRRGHGVRRHPGHHQVGPAGATLLIETIASAIQDFAEAKVSILDKAQLIEDLAQGATGSAPRHDHPRAGAARQLEGLIAEIERTPSASPARTPSATPARRGGPLRAARAGLAGGPAPHRRRADHAARRLRRPRRLACRRTAAGAVAGQHGAMAERSSRRRSSPTRSRPPRTSRPLGGDAPVSSPSPVEVEDWTRRPKTFKPAMTAQVGAPPPDVSTRSRPG